MIPRAERPGARSDTPRPTPPRAGVRAMLAMHRLFERGPIWFRVARWLECSAPGYRLFTRIEEWTKRRLFGCRMCGQCALPSTAYACPMTCPKQLRNGPCGGVSFEGMCEVVPELRCVWLIAFERAEQAGRVTDLRRLQRPIDQRKWGESSWVNYWQGRDEQLWTDDSGLTRLPMMLPDHPTAPRASRDSHTAPSDSLTPLRAGERNR